jgi:hypothetical protein
MSPTASSPTSFGSVTVKLDDCSYEIDLSKPDAAPLRAALERYVASRGEAANAGVTGQSASASPPSTDEWVEAIAVRLDSELHRLVHNDPSMTATDPAAVADRLLAAVPTRHDLDLLTGPFYDTTGLIKWLGVTRQALDARANTGSLLMCPLEDGTFAGAIPSAYSLLPTKTPASGLVEFGKRARTNSACSANHALLAHFPRVTLKSSKELFRAHRRANAPWWFSSDGTGRFDLIGSQGTCYLADSPEAALRESLGRVVRAGIVDVAELADRVISNVAVTKSKTLADTTSAKAANQR